MVEGRKPTLAERRAKAAAVWTDAEWAEVAAFLGPNADRFRSTWARALAKVRKSGNGNVFAWCWPAFFLSFAWFFYRRMWAAGAALLAIPIVLGWFLDIGTGATGALIAMSMFAKSFLLQHAVIKIDRIKAAGGGLDAIRAAAGVSTAGGVAGGVALLLLAGVSLFPLLGG